MLVELIKTAQISKKQLALVNLPRKIQKIQENPQKDQKNPKSRAHPWPPQKKISSLSVYYFFIFPFHMIDIPNTLLFVFLFLFIYSRKDGEMVIIFVSSINQNVGNKGENTCFFLHDCFTFKVLFRKIFFFVRNFSFFFGF